MSGETLKKSVTTIEALAIVVGMIIGSGIFLKPAIVLTWPARGSGKSASDSSGKRHNLTAIKQKWIWRFRYAALILKTSG